MGLVGGSGFFGGTFFRGTVFLTGTFFGGGAFCAKAAEVTTKAVIQVAAINHEERIIILTPALWVGCAVPEHTPKVGAIPRLLGS